MQGVGRSRDGSPLGVSEPGLNRGSLLRIAVGRGRRTESTTGHHLLEKYRAKRGAGEGSVLTYFCLLDLDRLDSSTAEPDESRSLPK